jgi:transposase-like protein
MVAPEREPLKDEVEIDEFYLGGVEEGRKGGRQHGKKVLVGVAVEVRTRGWGRLRLQVLKDATAESLQGFVKATTVPGAIVHTDGWQGYASLAKRGYEHRPRSQRAAQPGEQLLPRAHRAVSNLKAWINGTHRDVSDEHLPVYLDEYVFRHNRRHTPRAAFQTLLGLAGRHPPDHLPPTRHTHRPGNQNKPDTH